ncbi:hypothetical protein ACS0TY_025618 [Phlomoides rotata]
MECHWSRIRQTMDLLVQLYKASLKKKGKNVETNHIEEYNASNGDDENMTHLDGSDFFEDAK